MASLTEVLQIIDAKYHKFKTRIDVFRTATGTTKAIQSVLISANGTAATNYRGNIQREITGNDLFAF